MAEVEQSGNWWSRIPTWGHYAAGITAISGLVCATLIGVWHIADAAQYRPILKYEYMPDKAKVVVLEQENKALKEDLTTTRQTIAALSNDYYFSTWNMLYTKVSSGVASSSEVARWCTLTDQLNIRQVSQIANLYRKNCRLSN